MHDLINIVLAAAIGTIAVYMGILVSGKKRGDEQIIKSLLRENARLKEELTRHESKKIGRKQSAFSFPDRRKQDIPELTK